jgi:hypothetical protein
MAPLQPWRPELGPSRPSQNAELVLVLDQGREGRTDDNTDDNIQNLHIDNKLITKG